MNKEKEYVLGLDVSTSTIGLALYENMGKYGDLKLLHHVSPKIKPKPESKTEELFKKVEVFNEELLSKFKAFNITRVFIEEPLLSSNNVYTIATLLKFNGMISKCVHETLGVVPEYISSYDARKYAFPELMAVRKFKKDGTPLTEKEIAKNKPVLFGDYPFNVDKKMVIFEKICDIHPNIKWIFDKNNKLKKENFDMSDAACVCQAYMKMIGEWE